MLLRMDAMVDFAEQWAWSSYRAHAGLVPAPRWLATAELHGVLTGQASPRAAAFTDACRRYAAWVDAGRGIPLWRSSLRQGLYLGDDAFIELVQRAGL